MGKLKIAETLCRAGLHLGITTIRRILKEDPRPDPGSAAPCTGVSTAKRPNHVWHVDLTAVATSIGLWAPWLPFALPQRGPFCWWVAVVIDHYSRHVMGFAILRNDPTSVSIQSLLESAIVNASASPKYIICDIATRGRLMKLFPHGCREPPVPPGESTGMNQELPGQCNEARLWSCGVQVVRGAPSW